MPVVENTVRFDDDKLTEPKIVPIIALQTIVKNSIKKNSELPKGFKIDIIINEIRIKDTDVNANAFGIEFDVNNGLTVKRNTSKSCKLEATCNQVTVEIDYSINKSFINLNLKNDNQLIYSIVAILLAFLIWKLVSKRK